MTAWLWTAALWATAYAWARRAGRLRRDEALAYSGVVILAESVAAPMALGFAGLLRPSPAAAVAALLCAAHAASAWRAPKAGPARGPIVEAALWPGIAAAGAAFALRLAAAAGAPPDSWDGLSYHLPIALEWIRRGSLNLAGWFGNERYYAWNGELQTVWLALLDGGRLSAAKLSQLPALLVLTASAGALARRTAGARWSAACALAAFAAPMCLIQAGVPYVDLLHAACWTAAALAGLSWLQRPRIAHGLAFGAALGLTLGAKSTLYFAAPLALAPAWELWRERRRWRARAPLVGVVLLLIAVLGAAPYIRNFVERANPIFPFGLALLGKNVFPGPLSPGDLLVSMERWFAASPADWLAYPFHERVLGKLSYTYESGFGPLFAAGWALWPLAAWKSRARGASARFLTALVPFTALSFMTLQPVRSPRYVMFLCAVPPICAALALGRLRGRARAAVLSVWSLGAAWGALGVAAYAAENAGPALSLRALLSGRRADAGEYYKSVYPGLGEAWSALDARLAHGDVVALNYGELMLGWQGAPPRARVVVVRDRPSHYPEAFFGVTAADWLGVLESVNARWVVVWSPRWYPEEGARQLAWIELLPGRFAKMARVDGPMGAVEIFELSSARR